MTSKLARIARLHVALGREIRRLVAEEESAHGIAFIEQVARPEIGRPARLLISELEIHECEGTGAFIVARVEVEVIDALRVEPREQTRWVSILRGERKLILRRMRLLAAVEIAIAEAIADVARLEQAEAAAQLQARVACQRKRALQPVVLAARRIVGEEDESQRIARDELE